MAVRLGRIVGRCAGGVGKRTVLFYLLRRPALTSATRRACFLARELMYFGGGFYGFRVSAAFNTRLRSFLAM